MTLDSEVLNDGLNATIADILERYEDTADINDVLYGSGNLTGLDIDTDTSTFLQTYTANHQEHWNGVYQAALSEDPNKPTREAIRDLAYDVTALGLASQKNFEVVVSTAIKSTVSESISIEQAFVAYVSGQPVGMYFEKATGKILLSTTAPSETYYIPAGKYMAALGKAVEVWAIYETFKDTAHNAFNATLGDEQAPFDAAKDYLIAASSAIAGGYASELGLDPVSKALWVAVGAALGGTAAQDLTSELSGIINDAKVNELTEEQTLALIQDYIKSKVNDQWSAVGSTADDILDRAEDLATDLYDAIDGLANGPDADPADWPAAAPQPEWCPFVHEPFNNGKESRSPLVIDLSSGHTGIALTEFDAATTPTFFDLDSNGFAEQTAWVTGDTGLLVRDLDENGTIDNGDELFGSPTVDGFAKLAVLDSNHDLKIDSQDTAWNTLAVWVDSNGNASTEDGELHTLASLDIASIDLAGIAASTSTISGNAISHTSIITFTGGATAAIADAWFVTDPMTSLYNAEYTLDPETMFLPDLRGFGTIPDLTIAMSQDEDLKELVSDFVDGFSVSSLTDPDSLNAAMADILYTWAGVDGVDPGSRGYHVDAQHLEFLEALFGEHFYQTAAQSDQPWEWGGNLVEQSWNLTLATLKSFLELQAGFDLFDGTAVYDPRTGDTLGDKDLNETSIADLSSSAPSPGAENNAYWVEIATYIDNIKGIDNLSGTEEGWLDDAIYDTDSSLTWADVVDLYHNVNPGLPIDGTSGVDTLGGTSGDDTIWADSGNDTVNAGYGDDEVFGDAGDDTINGDAGNDILWGGDGSESSSGNDIINGGTGNDEIHGEDGDDTLDGGLGGNSVNGGAGNDAYVYGGGNDVIQELSGTDQIVLPEGVTAGDVTFYRVDSDSFFDDLLIVIDDATEGSIQITAHFYSGGAYAVETLVFYDTSTIDLTALTDYTVVGTTGDDTIDNLPDGSDYVIGGRAGADNIYGADGADVIDGGLGNDVLRGAGGSDAYVMSEGFDVVVETGGTDIIQIPADFTIEDLTIYRGLGTYANDLIVSVAGFGQIAVQNQFSDPGYAIETIHFEEDDSDLDMENVSIIQIGTSGGDSLTGIASGASLNDIMDGREGTDSINGGGGNDTLTGGTGNDALTGGSGDDTFVFAAGWGSDTVSENPDGGTDTIHLSGIDPEDIRMWTDGYGYLHLENTQDTSDNITIYAYYDGYGASIIGEYMEEVTFDPGYSTTWDLTGGLTLTGDNGGGGWTGTPFGDTITGGTGADNIYGFGGNDILYGAGGADTLNGGAGADTFLFESATALGASVTVADFNTGQNDVIDIADVLEGYYDSGFDAIADFVTLTTSGYDTLLSVDLDGTGVTYSATQIATLSNVTGLSLATLITNDNLIVEAA